MELETILEWLQAHWEYVALVLPFVLSILVLLLERALKGTANSTVSAAYRAAIHAAAELQEDGIAWVRSPDGVAFRIELVNRAYDMLPARVGPVPVGLLKLVVSRERFLRWVEEAFAKAVELAERLEYPLEVVVEFEPD